MSGTPGVVTVATTASSATALIFYSRRVTGGTMGNVSITAQDGTGFTLTSTGNETSTFNWWIINA
jgi:ribulose-5-phosphate 4-epimerase/fuculose-1-phosphate aldolase